MASQDQRAILSLFEKPYNATTATSLEVGTRIGIIPPTPTSDPMLGTATTIPRGVPFSTFFRNHRRAARDLSNYFLSKCFFSNSLSY
ncbi:hypothetical protein SK128_021341 [Halocaridina rubra]|uniref:Uncharacterized protein n=1 Tax=Halocaridina rubra TaxID=373956 RepID=A0AAN8X5G1_HALRR